MMNVIITVVDGQTNYMLMMSFIGTSIIVVGGAVDWLVQSTGTFVRTPITFR